MLFSVQLRCAVDGIQGVIYYQYDDLLSYRRGYGYIVNLKLSLRRSSTLSPRWSDLALKIRLTNLSQRPHEKCFTPPNALRKKDN